MKKITLLAAVIVVASFASCKKEKTCSCTIATTNSNPTFYPNPVSTETVENKHGKMSKTQANQICPESSTHVTNNNLTGNAANIETKTSTCTLK